MLVEIRAGVLELFEKHRARPGDPYDETHFLDFLLAEPSEKGALHNSFRGLRRYARFLDEVQFEFGVCFSIRDRDANYSIEQFVERVAQLRRSRRGSLRALKRQIRDTYDWNLMFFADCVFLMLGAAVRNLPLTLGTVVIVAAATNLGFALYVRSVRSYLHRLHARIGVTTSRMVQ